ncbi:MAG: DUF2264 domain-containing protein [Leeuwenhoekiella sp.]|jgi:hypothetical protein|uniref:DUF2264 domain-containing protein n=1 Tax=Leeuwenhoekiella TaxID=283735 RepID=UPI000C43C736|nr:MULTISPECIES: DUF2264 domain-containing protein [Leeuwenhoekiella]MAO43047.1 hypothetical protein [Leeuwenhoekiella sp.]HBT09002.1 hypothetical protein [Leeuwenhoekiella sp.]HCW63817.1 hypothetical protein [Leeuwenhoekiella sp.]|tara:strand:- start:64051 stop:65262 length:1212 start_codon:yes stop_codon:yes gene_type:complete
MGKLKGIFIFCFIAFNLVSLKGLAQQDEREYMIEKMLKIADPVLNNLAEEKLKKNMPIERSPGAWDDRTHVTYLEAFGRLYSGMAPWLELGPDDTPEGKLRKKYIDLVIRCLDNATNPESADFMNFNKDAQPLVDAAFLAQGLLRNPSIWEQLDQTIQKNIIEALKSTRVIRPYYSNWLLFSGMVEAALEKFDNSGDMLRIEYGLNKHKDWYLGDGMYGDGPDFHWDYYNSFVIQPFLLDIHQTLQETGNGLDKDYDNVKYRAKRYAAIQERLIGPEGTYPPIGRSLAYRFGAFQLLSHIALRQELPQEIKPAQVREALLTMVKRQIEAPGTFDENGWLKVGLYGAQNNIGEGYISTGSLYLCSEAFLILGLPETAPLWSDDYAAWTQKKIWSGENISIDHAH